MYLYAFFFSPCFSEYCCDLKNDLSQVETCCCFRPMNSIVYGCFTSDIILRFIYFEVLSATLSTILDTGWLKTHLTLKKTVYRNVSSNFRATLNNFRTKGRMSKKGEEVQCGRKRKKCRNHYSVGW